MGVVVIDHKRVRMAHAVAGDDSTLGVGVPGW